MPNDRKEIAQKEMTKYERAGRNTNKKRELSLLLHQASRRIYLHSDFGMRQTEILRILLEGPISQKKLQERLGIKAAAVSELVSKLEAKKLIERKRNDDDKRVVDICISPLAKERVEEKVRENVINVAGIPLEEEELVQLENLLSKLCKGYDEYDRGGDGS